MRARRRPPKSPVTRPRLWNTPRKSSRSPVAQIRPAPRLLTRARRWRSTEGNAVISTEHFVRAFFLPIVLSALATPAGAQSLQVIGYSGYLGEWELTATVTETASGRIKEYSGPLTMKHVGVCTQDGPEEKTGEMNFQISASSSRLNATISVAGVEC